MSTLSSFSQVNSKHEALFSVPVTSGISIMQKFSTNERTKLISDLNFLVNEYILVQDQKGQPALRAMKSASASFSFQQTYSKGSTFVTLSSNPSAQVLFTPIKNFTTGVRVSKTTRLYKTVYTLRCQMAHLNANTQLITNNFKQVDLIEGVVNVGSPEFSIGLQAIRRFVQPGVNFCVMSQISKNNRMIQMAVLKEAQYSSILRYQRTINETWSMGTQFRITSDLHAFGTIAWAAQLGKSRINSAISTNGIIESAFKRSVSDSFDIIVSGRLDHNRKSYKLGFALEWNQDK